MNRRAETADLSGSDVRRIGLPLALHTARIGHRNEHTVMRFRAQPQHSTSVGVWHHAIGILIAHVVEYEEQRIAVHRSIHRRTRADHAPNLPLADGQIGTIPFRRRHLRIQNGEIAVIRSIGGLHRCEKAQANSLQGLSHILNLTHGRQHQHCRFTLQQRRNHHPCRTLPPMIGTRKRIEHERLKTLRFQCFMKQIDIAVLPLQLFV